eukprot:11011386-Lingulodinium_polyedra.AAC.1
MFLLAAAASACATAAALASTFASCTCVRERSHENCDNNSTFDKPTLAASAPRTSAKSASAACLPDRPRSP